MAALSIGAAPHATPASGTRTASEAMTVQRFASVTTHNLMLLPSGITDWESDLRAHIMGQSDYLKTDDVLVLTELFDNSATDEELFPRLAAHHPYRTPVIGRSSAGWNMTTGGYYGTPFEDGGVAIASKWPILYRAQHLYGGGCGADYWASKGFAYAVIDVGGTRTHVVGTHLQANDSGCDAGEAARERARQMDSISTFLAQRSIPATEPVVIAGDFNIHPASSEYSSLLSRLHVTTPRTSPTSAASYDPTSNSIARYRDPRGTPGRLDHVFLRADHARPPHGWTNTVLDIHTPPYRLRDRYFRDYSDHYPVSAKPLAVIQLLARQGRAPSDREARPSPHTHWSASLGG
ncbi:sphingomyelin phosphodiesterase [Streptomyces virginiae]|uniref:sphingomyelin phosphodiesterase n=1 Tax=Streptomyces virginiae TaxID=1961 RepID=UPI0036B944B3